MKKEQQKDAGRPWSALMGAGLIALFLVARTGLAAAAVAAEQSTVTSTTVETVDVDTDKSYFDNPAQAAHASQLADKAALSDPSVQSALSDVQAAQDAVDAATTPEDKVAAEAALAVAEASYRDALAEATGTRSDEIGAMRTAGWAGGR